MKEAYYFPHFCNARHDRKIKRLRKQLGLEGYGIYFMLLEVLREQPEMRYPVCDIDLLADEFNTSEEKIKLVVTMYELFDLDESENFFSPRLYKYMQPYFEKSKRAKEAALKRWNAPKTAITDANAFQMLCKEKKRKEKKVKETKEVKEKRAFEKPTIEEIQEHCFERKNGIDAESFYHFYEAKNWMIGKTKMKSWKSAIITWEKRNAGNASNKRIENRSQYANL